MLTDVSRPRVAIIGAGPAGCAAGLALASRGFFPVLLEKGAPGKDKACGDAWIAPAIDSLRALEIDVRGADPEARPFQQMDGFEQGRKIWSLNFAPFKGATMRRAFVDQAMRDRAEWKGCEIVYGAEAKQLRVDEGRVELRVRFSGKALTLYPDTVILAGGAGSPLSRQAGLDGAPNLGAAISAYVEVETKFLLPTFLFGQPSPGYSWVFPVGEAWSNIGAFALGTAAALGLRKTMARLLDDLGAEPKLRGRGGILSLWSGAGAAWSHPAGIVSCGDAAGLVDPLSGEGLTAALISGIRAGEATALYLEGRPSALAEYGRWVRDWGQARYAPTLENRVFAAWVGLAPTERRLLGILAGLEDSM